MIEPPRNLRRAMPPGAREWVNHFLSMRFETHVHDWEEMAKNPLWAVLTGKRDWDLNEFFATGAADAESLFAVCDRLGLPQRRNRALDFGCGVGRVTRHLAARFAECW